jgi:hypothetical protein
LVWLWTLGPGPPSAQSSAVVRPAPAALVPGGVVGTAATRAGAGARPGLVRGGGVVRAARVAHVPGGVVRAVLGRGDARRDADRRDGESGDEQ